MLKTYRLRPGARRLLALAVLCAAGASALAQTTTLRVRPFGDLKAIDPIVNSDYMARNHGYMVYDTLFGTDAEGRIKPQIGSGGRTGVLEYPQTMTDSSGQPPGTGNPCPPI